MYSSDSPLSTILMIIFMVLICAGFGCIPAHIAKNKGYRFGIWGFTERFSSLFLSFTIALLPNKNNK